MKNTFPSVVQWWWLSLRRNFSSARRLGVTAFFATVLITTVAAPVLIVSNGISEQKEGPTSQLNVIEVYLPPEAEAGGITDKTLDELRDIQGVQDAVIDLRSSISSASMEAWSANLHVLRPWLLPPGVEREALSGNEVILPDSIDGIDMSPYVGREIEIAYIRGTEPSVGESAYGAIRVVDVYPATWTGYGEPGVALASEELVVQLYAARYALQPAEVLSRIGVPGVWVQTVTDASVDSVMRAIRELGLGATAQRDQVGALPGLLSLFPMVLTVVSVCMVLLLVTQVLQMVKTGIEQRVKEFGLLRMRGYTTGDIRKLVTLEVTSGVAVGSLVGTLLGTGLGWWLAEVLTPKEVIENFEPGWILSTIPMLIALMIGIVLLALVAGLVSSRRMNRNDPFLLVLKS